MEVNVGVEAAVQAIDQLALVPIDGLAPHELISMLRSLKVASSKLDATIARLTHLADATGAVVGTGSRDTADWLAKQTGTSTRKNRTAAELGAAMSRSGELAAAVTAGTLSFDKAGMVVGAAADEVVDADLLAALEGLPLNAVRPAVEEWRARKHPERDVDVAEVQRTRRFLRLTGQPDGMTRVDGLLDPLSAVKVRTTLDAIMNESAVDNTARTREQRCADALTQLCDAASKGEIVGGRSNAKVLVTVPFETIAERASERGRTHVGPTLDAASVRQLACDAGIHRVITGPGSAVLDLGRTNRLVSDSQFTALVVRDRHCRWPGCTIRATWCDAHHIVEWSEHGPTDLSNLALLCHRHHQLSHQPGWSVVGGAELIEIRHPDGTTETSRPPGVHPLRADSIGGSGPTAPACRNGRPATDSTESITPLAFA